MADRLCRRNGGRPVDRSVRQQGHGLGRCLANLLFGIGDAALGARLLATSDALEAGKIAALLDKLNRERKAIEQAMLDAAMVEAGVMLDADPDLPMLILGSAEWHKGVVGLVASRLVERYQRPACVISWTSDEGSDANGQAQGTGSLRSVAGVDIGSAIRAAVQDGLLVKGGGHAMAAGLTVERSKMDALQAFMAQRLVTASTRARDTAGLDIDGALTPASVSGELIDLLERAGPYGQGNPSPRFVFPAHRIKYAKVMCEAHVRVTLEAGDGSKLDGIAFRAIGSPIGDLLLGAGGGLLAGCIAIIMNRPRGQMCIALRWSGAEPSGRAGMNSSL